MRSRRRGGAVAVELRQSSDLRLTLRPAEAGDQAEQVIPHVLIRDTVDLGEDERLCGHVSTPSLFAKSADLFTEERGQKLKQGRE